jgi:tRNA (adenine22-N1)-methyltransferase
MPLLDKRLSVIFKRIPQGARLIDVGCDHGKLGAEAVITGRAESVIATDISAKSLEKAKKLIDSLGISDKMTTRSGDGLDPISAGEGDTLIIAGMGAREIIGILERSKLVFNTYIFSPHSEIVEFRKYLASSSYSIKSDDIIKSAGKFYAIIVAVKGYENPSYRDIMLGRGNKTNDYYEFVMLELKRTEKLLTLIPEGDIRYTELIKYREVLKEEKYD